MSQKKDREKVLFFRESAFRVARLIFNYPNRTFHIRMLEREVKLSTTAIKEAVKQLEYFKIIKAEKTPLTTDIKADTDSEAYRFYKTIFNLYRLKRYSFADNLVDAYNNPEAVVLFGSFAKGEDIEGSDVDILIITQSKPKYNIDKMVSIFEKELNRKINIHTISSLKKSSDEFRNALANGIVLHGYLKVV